MTSFTVENFEADDPQTEKLRTHLQADDFFKVETFPTSTFELTEILKSEGDFNSVIVGNLTILETTKSITFNANVNIDDIKVIIKSEDFSIDRTIWGLVYNTEGTKDVPTDYLIANDIGFTLNVTITK